MKFTGEKPPFSSLKGGKVPGSDFSLCLRMKQKMRYGLKIRSPAANDTEASWLPLSLSHPPATGNLHALHSLVNRYPASMAHIKQSRPDSGLGLQVKNLLKLFPVHSLGIYSWNPISTSRTPSTSQSDQKKTPVFRPRHFTSKTSPQSHFAREIRANRFPTRNLERNTGVPRS